MTAREAAEFLTQSATEANAKASLRFFKTGAGDYGEGDRFLGVKTPAIRAAAKQFKALPLGEVRRLLRSGWHEERALALAILVLRDRDEVRDEYLANLRYVNNWDLVDMSAPYILDGADASLLERLAKSVSLWDRRIAMLATLRPIKRGDFRLALRIAATLLRDEHDLIHKAVGWMLREIGDRDRAVADGFLRKHAPEMPRTALRYAIEKFPEAERKRWLAIPRRPL
jgi:3-methyladenine DNA glycosylase AlkD